MKRTKLSRADVGNMLRGVAVSTLQEWKGETRELPISKLMELDNILKTTANCLLTGKNETNLEIIPSIEPKTSYTSDISLFDVTGELTSNDNPMQRAFKIAG